MTEFIAEFFSNIFGDNAILATIIVSMVPLMELKGGIPFGMSEAFWGANALGRWQAFGLAYLGCLIVTVLLYFLFVPIMKWLRKTKVFKGLANYIDNKIKRQTSKIEEGESVNKNNEAVIDGKVQTEEGVEINAVQDGNVKSRQIKLPFKKRLARMIGVLIFVAIPLPLTGVWTGTCIAVILNLNFIETLLSVGIGNLIAGLIISTICVIFPQFTHILIYIFLILIAIVIIAEIIRAILNKNKSKQK